MKHQSSNVISRPPTVWSEGYKPCKEDLKGLHQYRFETAGGLVIDCHLSYEAGEAQTNDHPGSPESCTLEFALVGGIDISEVIGDTKDTIEEEALEQMSANAKSSKEDAMCDAYEARREDEALAQEYGQ